MEQKSADKKKVLLVDDDELGATALSQRLSKRGYEVQIATKSLLAWKELETNEYDLVLLDIIMPELDGISLLRKIRSRYSPEELPVIMVTIVNDSEEIYEALKIGANDYFSKPVNIETAIARIRGQLSAVDLRKLLIKKQEVEAVTALVVTYHHEINNPLTVAKSELNALMSDSREEKSAKKFKAVLASLDRIQEILKKIKAASEANEIEFSKYAGSLKMMKIKK